MTVTASPRQGLNARQFETVERLLGAGEAELDAVGPDAMTIRTVAQRAGVSPATAYTYLASKQHLFAELFWRRLATDPHPKPTGTNPTRRMQSAMRHLVELFGTSPHLATAVNQALLGTDPEVVRLRAQIGADLISRFREAAGEPAAPRVLDALTLVFSGALLQTGLGMTTYDEMADRLDEIVELVMKGHP